jgi:hypothetical protein
MRVCRTVQGEQPISHATARMLRGFPSAGPEPGGARIGPGSRGNGPGWGGQWGGQCCPPQKAEKPRKRADLRGCGARAFGAEVELFLIPELGSLMAMVVLARSVK